jgi:FMN phosphatase YigB (HAD superfamily)
MKLILDFDDVVFDTKSFKTKRLFKSLIPVGLSAQYFKKHYARERIGRGAYIFSEHLQKIQRETGIPVSIPKILRKITKGAETFLNPHIVRLMKEVGKKHTVLVTQGEPLLQQAKIRGSSVHKLVSSVTIVGKGESKETALRAFCSKHKNEICYFIDDSFEHFILARTPKNLVQIFLPKPGDSAPKEVIEAGAVIQISRRLLPRLSKERLETIIK